jgi:hypothetical protein
VCWYVVAEATILLDLDPIYSAISTTQNPN